MTAGVSDARAVIGSLHPGTTAVIPRSAATRNLPRSMADEGRSLASLGMTALCRDDSTVPEGGRYTDSPRSPAFKGPKSFRAARQIASGRVGAVTEISFW
jgi:hypothetical protein